MANQIKEEYSDLELDQFSMSHDDLVTASHDPKCEKSRPGRKAKLPDSALTPADLEKREIRRIRNKQAARRCRQRRLEKTFNLEQKASSIV